MSTQYTKEMIDLAMQCRGEDMTARETAYLIEKKFMRYFTRMMVIGIWYRNKEKYGMSENIVKVGVKRTPVEKKPYVKIGAKIPCSKLTRDHGIAFTGNGVKKASDSQYQYCDYCGNKAPPRAHRCYACAYIKPTSKIFSNIPTNYKPATIFL